jgi:hypothetical protein
VIYVENFQCTVFDDDGHRLGVIHQDPAPPHGFYFVPRGTPSRTGSASFSKYKTLADLKCSLEATHERN